MNMISTVVLQPLKSHLHIRDIVFRLLNYFHFSSQLKSILKLSV